jgi:arylsulfatase A-like enzyme
MNKIISFLWILILINGCQPKRQGDNSIVDRPPNFIVILTDDQQYDAAGFTGTSLIRTPNLDRMAKGALKFTDAQVAFSLCSPSRAALLTGRYGTANGVLGLGSALKPDERTFAQLLKSSGYTTGQFGKWHIQQGPGELGFDIYDYCEGNGTYYGRKFTSASGVNYPEMHCDEYAVERSIDFLEAQVQQENPFLLFLNTQTPHMNGELVWDALPATKASYRLENMPVPATRLDSLVGKPPYLKGVRNRTQALNYGYPNREAIQRHTLDYYSVVTEMDAFLGKLFLKIKTLGLSENTYIIFMSDNGWMLGDHGFTSKVLPYQPSTHVPFFIKGPALVAGTNKSIVSNLDVFPTILALADLPIPTSVHGKSLTPLLVGNQGSSVRDHFVYEGLGSYGGSWFNLAIITQKYRYIETFQDSSLAATSFQELYQRENDPLEMVNLAGDEDCQATIDSFRMEITDFKNQVYNFSK